MIRSVTAAYGEFFIFLEERIFMVTVQKEIAFRSTLELHIPVRSPLALVLQTHFPL